MVNQQVHHSVAQRLVPTGESLLQTNASTAPLPGAEKGRLFDEFFMTKRVRLPHHQVVLQLLRRLQSVGADIMSHGLYASDVEEPPSFGVPPTARYFAKGAEEQSRSTLYALACQPL
jgi:hypothetical protein